MKKFLSLVLALVMVMSLTVISAGADDFTDYDEVTYDEAVDVITALDIMDGYGETFGPTGGLSRGAAAKIICNLILGPTTARALSADTAPYPDVPVANEFSGYIAYCQAQGIISGYSDGTFKPTAPLSNYAFMKMLLGALGYDAEIEKYVGANWSVQVAKQAVGIGLDDGLEGELNGTAPATREQAALYAFNTLKAIMVEYPERTEITTADGVTVTTNSARIDVPNDLVGPETIEPDYKMQFAEKYFDKLTRINNIDAFGRPANEWKYKSEVIGLYDDPSTLIATYTKKAPQGELFTLIGSSIVDGLEDGDYALEAYVDGEKVVDVNEDSAQSDREEAVANLFVNKSSAAAEAPSGKGTGVSGNGIITEVYMDDYSNVRIVMISTWLGKAAADYNASREAVTVEPVEINSDSSKVKQPTLPTLLEQEDFDVDEIVEGDYILMQYSYMTGDVEVAEKAELLVGEVSEFTVKDYVIIDGEKYSYNKLVGDSEKEDEYTIGKDASVVLDAAGYIIFVDEALSTSSYVFIEAAGDKGGLGTSAVAGAYYLDGTYAEIDVEKIIKSNGNEIKGSSLTTYGPYLGTAGWFTFIESSNGKHTLSEIRTPRITNSVSNVADASNDSTPASPSAPDVGDQIVFNGKVKFLEAPDTYSYAGTPDANISVADVKGNANTIFLVLDNEEDVYVYTGIANVPNIYMGDEVAAGAVTISWVEKDGYAQYVFIDLKSDPNSSVDDVNSVANYLFLLKQTDNKTVTVDNETYWQYKVLFDGEEMTKYIEAEDISKMTNEQGVLAYKVKANDKEYITSATEIFDGDENGEFRVIPMSGVTVSQKGKTITVGSESFLTDADTDINLIVGDDCVLLEDKGADYELHIHQTLGTVAGVLYGASVHGRVYVALDENDNDLATAIYIYADKATTVGVTPPGEEYTVTLSGDVATQTKETVGGATSFNITPEAGYTYTVDKGTINADFTTISISGVTENTTITVTKTPVKDGYVALAEAVTDAGVTLGAAKPVTGANAAGTTVINFTLNLPDWVPTSATVTVGLDKYLSEKTDLGFLEADTDTATWNSTTEVWEVKYTDADGLTAGAVVIAEVTSVTWNAVKVRYFDGDGTTPVEITSTKMSSGADTDLTLVNDGTGATLNFKVITSSTASGGSAKLSYTVGGALTSGAVTSATAFTTDNTKQTTGSAVNPNGNGYVDVTITGLKNITETWSITAATASLLTSGTGAAIKTFNTDLATVSANDDTVEILPAVTASIAGGTKVSVEVKINSKTNDDKKTATGDVIYAYDVSVTFGTTTLTKEDVVVDASAVKLGDIVVNGNINIANANVTVTPSIDEMTVKSVALTGSTVALTFNYDVDASTATAANLGFTDAGSGPVEIDPSSIVVSGKTVTFGFLNGTYGASDTIVPSGVAMSGVASNTCGSTVTFSADDAVASDADTYPDYTIS